MTGFHPSHVLAAANAIDPADFGMDRDSWDALVRRALTQLHDQTRGLVVIAIRPEEGGMHRVVTVGVSSNGLQLTDQVVLLADSLK